MSDAFYVDRVNMERRMGDVVALVDGLDAALADMPGAADGGAATALISFIAEGGAEAANEYAGAVRLIGAITSDVMRNISTFEDEVTDDLSNLQAELED